MNAPDKKEAAAVAAVTKPFNIYAKLQKARVLLQAKPMKRTGKNTYSDYTYFELEDFLPQAIQCLNEVGICSIVTFDSEWATLSMIDVDAPESFIDFRSPMGAVTLKGAHEIQNIGAVQSYQRRYLYLMAMEIAEHDALDQAPLDPEALDSADLLEKFKGNAAKGMAALTSFLTMCKGENARKLYEANKEALEQIAKEADAPKPYDAKDFAKNLASWTKLIQSGRSTPEQIIAKLESKYSVSDAQKESLRQIVKQEVTE